MIGLTGGIASGKSAVAALFAELGAGIVDADQVAREVVAPGTPALHAIVERFGKTVLNTDGSLNRQTLRQQIFQHPLQRLWLEGLLHPLIRTMMQQQAQRLKTPYGIAVIPLLKNPADYPWLQRILVVDAPKNLQLQRLQQRDHIDKMQAEAILAAQLSREERLALADDVLENTGNLATLSSRVQQLHHVYSELACKLRK